MTEIKDVLLWANEVGAQALTEARAGNPMLANRIASNSAMKLYFDNVVAMRNVTDTSFAAFYPAQWTEITRLYEAYQQDEEIAGTVDKVAALETKFDAGFAELKGMITKLTEAQAPAKRGKAKAKPEDEETEEETPEVETPEAEA